MRTFLLYGVGASCSDGISMLMERTGFGRLCVLCGRQTGMIDRGAGSVYGGGYSGTGDSVGSRP